MRSAFVGALSALATEDQRIFLLTGDLGFMALEPFRDAHPDRFLNVGVAEQNLVGLATGLAEAGYTPYCYSIATFASMRPFEFFRNGAVWHDLPVRLVGMGGGFEYGSAGITHHAIEDIGAMRLLPRVTVVAPADAEQTPPALRYAQTRPGPVYLRLGKDDKRRVPGLNGAFDPERVSITRQGSEGLVLAVGGAATEAAEVAESLCELGISCSFGVVANLAPSPRAHLVELLRVHKWVATVEAHVPSGALGSIVADAMVDAGIAIPCLRCAIDDPLRSDRCGNEAFMHEVHGLSAKQLERRLLDFAERAA